MAASFLITLREGFEAALIVAIVLAYLRQIGRKDPFRYVWLGTAAALAISFAVGAAAWRVLGGLEGTPRRLLFAVICLTATGALTALLAYRATGSARAALGAAALLAVCAPQFVYATQVYPEAPAALLVSACAWLALTRRGGWRTALLLALGLNALVWLGAKYAAFGGVLALVAHCRLAGRPRALLLALLAAGAALYAWFHLAVYGGLTPYAVNRLYAGSSTVELLGAHLALGDRLYRLIGLWTDREFGLFRWAPVLLLAPAGLVPAARRPPLNRAA